MLLCAVRTLPCENNPHLHKTMKRKLDQTVLIMDHIIKFWRVTDGQVTCDAVGGGHCDKRWRRRGEMKGLSGGGEAEEMKGNRGEVCRGRPGGDQWAGCDAIWQVQLGDCPPPSAANWSIWRPITAAHVTRASSNPIITHVHTPTSTHMPSVQTSNNRPSSNSHHTSHTHTPLWSSGVPVHAPT